MIACSIFHCKLVFFSLSWYQRKKLFCSNQAVTAVSLLDAILYPILKVGKYNRQYKNYMENVFSVLINSFSEYKQGMIVLVL